MIKIHIKESWRKLIASLLPNDRLFKTKNIIDKVLYRFLKGATFEFSRVETLIRDVANQYDPQQTIDLLERWESAVGLPDDCISLATTIDERRENVLLKLRSLYAQSEQDFIDLAELLGYTITIEHGSDKFYPPYEIPHFLLTPPQGRFIWIVRSSSVLPQKLKCLFNKLKPVHTKLIFYP